MSTRKTREIEYASATVGLMWKFESRNEQGKIIYLTMYSIFLRILQFFSFQVGQIQTISSDLR